MIFFSCLLCFWTQKTHAKCEINNCDKKYSNNYSGSQFNERNISYIKKNFIDKKFLLEDIGFVLTGIASSIEKIVYENNTNSQEDVKKINNGNIFVDIESDIQYVEGSNLITEGNVSAIYQGKKLIADKIIFDKENKILKINGNIRFEKGKQFFTASKIEYNTITKNGFIIDAYGVLDIDTFIYDLNLNIDNELNKKNKDSKKNVRQKGLNYIYNIEKRNTNFIGIENRFKLKSFQTKLTEITRWRFKSARINIKDDKFTSDKVFFSNDPFNKPQLLFESRNFEGELIGDKLSLIGNTFIILDNKLRIPLGKRQIYEDDYLAKWGFGYEKKEKDGLFLYRNIVTNLFDEGFKLKLKPYFLVQRAYEGKTNAFVAPDMPLNSNKVENDIDYSDYFALDMELNGNINKWKFESINSVNSLKPNRINNALRSQVSLSRSFYIGDKEELEKNIDEDQKDKCNQLYSKFNEKNLTPLQSNNLDIDLTNIESVNKTFNEKYYIDDELAFCKRQNIDQGKFINLSFFNIYRNKISKGFQGETEIVNGFGAYVSNSNSWKFDDDSVLSYAGFFDIGNFTSELKSSGDIGSLYRSTLNASVYYNFPLWLRSDSDEEINSDYKFSPTVSDQGIILNSSVTLSGFLYSEGSYQNALSVNIGPQITLGAFKGKLLDYTNLSMNYNRNFTDGEAPFNFDDIGDSSNISMSFAQQIFGPFLLRYDTYMNLDKDSSDYGRFKDPNYTLEFSRRAYGIEAYYNTSQEIFGVKLKIFNFGYEGKSEKF